MRRREREYEPVYGFPIPRLLLGSIGNFALVNGSAFAGVYAVAALKNPMLSVASFSFLVYFGARLFENAQNLNTVWYAVRSLYSSDPKHFDVEQEKTSVLRKIIWPARYRAMQKPF